MARDLWRDPDATKHCHLDYFLGKLERAYDTLGISSCLPYLEVLTHDMADLSAVHDRHSNQGASTTISVSTADLS